MRHYTTLFLICLLCGINAYTQSEKEQLIKGKADTAVAARPLSVRDSSKNILAADTITIKKHEPRKATFRSAVLPGWGQAYNREYWKIPLVYAAVGIPAGFYIYNTIWYKRSKLAYEIIVSGDTSRKGEINRKLNGLSATSLQYYRNAFRKDRDYSILYFLIAWGLNVADATVFAHLKDFDVSDDLAFQVKPGYSAMAHTTGLSFVLAVKSGAHKSVTDLR